MLRLAKRDIEVSQVETAEGEIPGILHGGDILFERLLEHAALVLREQTARRTCQSGGGLGAHGLDRVIEQRRHQADVALGVRGRQMV